MTMVKDDKRMMETDKKNCGRRQEEAWAVARETFERRLPARTMESPPDEWKLGKEKWKEANSGTTGNYLPVRPQGFACPANAGKLLPEKHTSHNRKNDGYQPMDCSAKNAREHIGSRRMLRSRASQCQGYIFPVRVFVRTTEQWIRANGVLRKRLAKKPRRLKQSGGRREQWCLLWWTTLVMPWHCPIDQLGLSCKFSLQKSAKEKEWEMSTTCHQRSENADKKGKPRKFGEVWKFREGGGVWNLLIWVT